MGATESSESVPGTSSKTPQGPSINVDPRDQWLHKSKREKGQIEQYGKDTKYVENQGRMNPSELARQALNSEQGDWLEKIPQSGSYPLDQIDNCPSQTGPKFRTVTRKNLEYFHHRPYPDWNPSEIEIQAMDSEHGELQEKLVPQSASGWMDEEFGYPTTVIFETDKLRPADMPSSSGSKTQISSNLINEVNNLKEITLELKDILQNMEEPMKQLKREGFWKVQLFATCKGPATVVQEKLNTLLSIAQRLQAFPDITLKETAITYWQDAHNIKLLSDKLLRTLDQNDAVVSVNFYKAIVEGTDLLQKKVEEFSKIPPEPVQDHKIHRAPVHVHTEVDNIRNEYGLMGLRNPEERPYKPKVQYAMPDAISKIRIARDELVGNVSELKYAPEEFSLKCKLASIQHLLPIFKDFGPSIISHGTGDPDFVRISNKIRRLAADIGRNLKQIIAALQKGSLGDYQHPFETIVKNVGILDKLVDEISGLQVSMDLGKEPSGNNAINLPEELETNEESPKVEEIVKVVEARELNAPMEKKTFYHSPKPSTSTDSKDFSLQNTDHLVFQQILSKFCDESIHICKAYYKNLTIDKNDGSRAMTLRHFMKIESDILNFQMRTASIALNTNDEGNLENEFFPVLSFGLSEKTVIGHQKNMKEMLKKIQEELRVLEKRFRKKTTIKILLDENLHRLAVYILSMYHSNQELKMAGETKENLNKSYAFSTLTWMFRLLFSMETQEVLSEASRTNFEECIKCTKNKFDTMDLS